MFHLILVLCISRMINKHMTMIFRFQRRGAISYVPLIVIASYRFVVFRVATYKRQFEY